MRRPAAPAARISALAEEAAVAYHASASSSCCGRSPKAVQGRQVHAVERVQRQTVRSIAWWIASLAIGWVIAYSLSFWIFVRHSGLAVTQIVLVGGGVAYFLGQLVRQPEKRWVPRTIAITATIAGVVLVVLTIALPARL